MPGISEHTTDIASDVQSTNLLDYWLERLDDNKTDVKKRPDDTYSPETPEVFREFTAYGWKKGLERSSLNDTKDAVKEQKDDSFLMKIPEFFREFISHFTDSTRDISDNELKENLDDEYYDIVSTFSDAGRNNCFACAMGWLKNPNTDEYFDHKVAPGDISGKHMPSIYELVYSKMNEDQIRETIEYYWRKDCEHLGKELIKVDSGDVELKDGERLIAMMYGDTEGYGPDYHFLFKGKYDTWYHKPGLTLPMRTDDRGEIIHDPKHCYLSIYNHFCGYYIVRDKA